ncbi:MAG: S9 family peptidase, partial [Flavobacteriales bacterium]
MSKRLLFLFLIIGSTAVAQENLFQYEDVFDLQYVRDPQIHPDGNQIVYRRMQMDIMKDRAAGNLWIRNASGAGHQKLTAYEGSEYGATWSPNGDRLAYIRPTSEGAEIYVYWTSTKQTAKISQLQGSPSNLSWSPDGRRLVFTMKVAAKPPVLVQMPAAPKGAKWAKKPRITDRLYHEADGRGYIPPGHTHIFMIAAEGS